ncbi:hypothetical protein ACN28E_03015 [Archangium lansingense]|uniref:hypothetical protein n=1 Tax=Archangium lansingense TaxID=2995310 RepID=UPI003B7E634C
MTGAELLSEDALEFEEGMDELADELDGWDEFELDEASGLYTPSSAPRIISGPAAVTLARGLDAFVLESMDADDADAFLRRIRRGISRVGRLAGSVARTAAPVLRRAAPLLRRALPALQRVAGLAGPWGRLVSAGIGAAQGALEGRGWRGILGGAVGGLIPGVGGQIASSILRGDGADDDAALDALADMAEARQVTPAVALPLGAGLAARAVSQQVVPSGTPVSPALQQALRARTQGLERLLLGTALRMPGNAGQRLRLLRGIEQLIVANLRRRAPTRRLGAMTQVARGVSRRVLAQAASSPGLGALGPRVAAQRVAARQRILRGVPVSTLGAASARAAVT